MNTQHKELIEQNIGLAYTASKQYDFYEIPSDERVSIALEVLVKAAAQFNPELGYAFSSYLYNAVKWALLNEVKKRIHPHYSHTQDHETDPDYELLPQKEHHVRHLENEVLDLMYRDHLKEVINDHSRLDAREKEIALLYLGLTGPALTFTEIGKYLGISRQAANQSWLNIRLKLQQIISREDINGK